MNDCVFCKIANNEMDSNIIYKDQDICAFLDIEPINPYHVLIIPNKHHLDIDELYDEIILKMLKLAKRLVCILKSELTPDGYSIMQNGGKFNDIGHFHLHIFPRYINDGFGWKFKENNLEQDLTRIKTNLISWIKK